MDKPLVIPPDRLSREALDGLVEEFVLREGTDYGHSDHTLAAKRAAVLRQIERSEVVIVHDTGSWNCNPVLRRELPPP